MSASEMDPLEDTYSFAVQLGKDAGQLLLEAAKRRYEGASQDRNLNQVEKLNAVDLVTKTDEGMCPMTPQSTLTTHCG